jgi:hypothetical protein
MKKYDLRWYFEYLDRPDYYGGWNSTDPRRPAWSHAFEGLTKAMIQARDGGTEFKVLAECPGQDFQNFQWIAIARANEMQIRRGLKLPAVIVGLQIQHRYGQIQCYIDGTVKHNKIVYPTIHFASYGR